MQQHFDEFRTVLKAEMKRVEALDGEPYSTAWFLLRYLRRIHQRVQSSNSPREVENTIRALIRFYLDRVDEGSALAQSCHTVLRYHRRSLRMERGGSG